MDNIGRAKTIGEYRATGRSVKTLAKGLVTWEFVDIIVVGYRPVNS